MPMNTRFMVIVPSGFQAKYQNTARIGGGVELIGRYVGNRNLELVMGNSVTVATQELLSGTDIHTLAKQMGTSVRMLELHYSKLTATMAAEKLA